MQFISKPGKYPPAGLYGWQHLLAVIIILGLVVLFMFLSRKTNVLKVKLLLKQIFWIVLILEILKIVYTIAWGGKNIEDIISLSFCALFLYALGFASYGNANIEKMGLTYMFYGGMIAGLIYLITPVASLSFYPLWHFRTIQSLVFHGIMIYCGLLVITKKMLIPTIKDLKPFFLFSILFGVLSVLSNWLLDTNYMYLNDRLTTSIMSLFNFMPDVIYIPFVILGQIFGAFFITYGVYKLCEFIGKKKKKNWLSVLFLFYKFC